MKLVKRVLFASIGIIICAACDQSVDSANMSSSTVEISPNVSSVSYDVIIREGTIYDGTGSKGLMTDLGIIGDQIVAIGDLSQSTAKKEIDAKNKVVAPGIINMLSWAVTSLIEDGRGLSDIKQGVTLEVFGEGWSMGPVLKENGAEHIYNEFSLSREIDITWNSLGEYLQFMEDRGVSPNIASFIGATTVRLHQLGNENRAPTKIEMDNMKDLVRVAMKEGAMGLGSSLIYPPAFFATTNELTELAKVVGEYDGMYISHMRSEGDSIESAVDELISIARNAKVAAEIYHLKFAGRDNWNKFEQIVAKVEKAREQGLAITADMYTYEAGATMLTATLPPWASDGGLEKLIERLKETSTRKKISEEMALKSPDWENLYLAAGPAGIQVNYLRNKNNQKYIGMTVAEIAKSREQAPIDTIIDLIIEDNSPLEAIYFLMDKNNLSKKAVIPWLSFGSDAEAVAPEGKVLDIPKHPRAYGTFARVLGNYVRDLDLMPMEKAIFKLSGLPATNLKLKQRGFLKLGYFADVIVFDPKIIADKATFEKPHQLAVGMEQVFINGVQVLSNGEHTGKTPGRFIKGPGYKKNE